MLLCAVGDSHGHLDAMYSIVEALERELGEEVDLVLQVGDFGVWPDPQRLDEATRRHGGAGDFPQWLAQGRAAPRPTIFIPGNHEDFGWLIERGAGELLPGLRFLPWGGVVEVEGLRIGGLGGCYSPRSYRMPGLSGKRRRHYCREEVRALSRESLDVLLIHDAPAGRFSDIRPGVDRRWETKAEGLGELIAATRPKICLHGHLHGRFERRLDDIRVTGLTAVPWPGCAVVIETSDDAPWTLRAEWSRAAEGWARAPADIVAAAQPVDLRPLVDALEEWRDAVLDGAALSRERKKRLYGALKGRKERRRVLMAALGGQELEGLLEGLLEVGWSASELHRLVESRPDPARLAGA